MLKRVPASQRSAGGCNRGNEVTLAPDLGEF